MICFGTKQTGRRCALRATQERRQEKMAGSGIKKKEVDPLFCYNHCAAGRIRGICLAGGDTFCPNDKARKIKTPYCERKA